MDNLTNFFNQFITLSFWSRLFSWGQIRKTATVALKELQALSTTLKEQEKEIYDLKAQLTTIIQDKNHLKSTLNAAEVDKQEYKAKNAILNTRLEERDNKITELSSKVQALEAQQENLRKRSDVELNRLMQSRDSFENDKQKLHEEQLAKQKERFEKMKLTWSTHEAQVEQDIRALCDRHIIKYLEDVPFHGRPDNAIKICEEIIIFDAKSPANDDLNNFPKYIQSQAENAKKYANKEGVRKDVYLVVPSTTVEVIKQWTYELADYTVYIITRDALEPVLLSLKRLEDYEFAEQLSPEERTSIVRLLAKFAHNSKRKIQIDQFFADEFLQLLKRCERELPADFQQEVVEMEKQQKLNPPMENRKKMISTTTLLDQHLQTNAEAGVRHIQIPKDDDEARKVI